jgi:hypothetical protein
LQGAHQQFQQGGLAGAVIADNTQALAFRHGEGNVIQHVVNPVAGPTQKYLPQAILGTFVDLEVLAEVVDYNAMFTH